ncbi:hypothetical protein Emag_005032 [Eimeria magna]
MSEQANKHLAKNESAEGLDSNKLKAAALRSLRLFDSRTPRTSASVRGRWTAEFQAIKAALLRQRAAKSKALRGPTTCSCCHTKGMPGHSTGFASAAAHASKAFAEVARLTPRRANHARLWGLGLVASSDAAAAEAAAATGVLQELNASRRQLLAREGFPPSEGPATHPPPPPTRVPAFLWKEYFDTPISKAALSYREAARIVLPPVRAREATTGSRQSETHSHQQAGRQVPPASFFITAPSSPVTEATASPAAPASLESARRRSSSHPAKHTCPSGVSSGGGLNIAQQKSCVGGQQQKKRVSDAAATADAFLQRSKGAHGMAAFPGSTFWRKSVEPPHRANDPVAGNAKAGQAHAGDGKCQEGVRSLAAEFLQKLSREGGSGLESTLSSRSQKRGRSKEPKRIRRVFQRPHHSVELSSQQTGIPKPPLAGMQSESSRAGSSSTSSSLSSGNGTASQPSVKLERLLAEADEVFWVSRKLDHMVGWISNRARRATSAGRRRSFAGHAAAAGRGTLSPELLQQQLQQLVARSAPAGGRSAGAGSDAQQAHRPEMAASPIHVPTASAFPTCSKTLFSKEATRTLLNSS